MSCLFLDKVTRFPTIHIAQSLSEIICGLLLLLAISLQSNDISVHTLLDFDLINHLSSQIDTFMASAI